MKITKPLFATLAICAACLATAQESQPVAKDSKATVFTTAHEARISDGMFLICRQNNVKKRADCANWVSDVGEVALQGYRRIGHETVTYKWNTDRNETMFVLIRWSSQ